MPSLKPTRGTLLNKNHPLARGLVGCWLFNEGSGKTVFDLSGNGNKGTFAANAHFVPGPYGDAIEFDGTGDYISVDSNNCFDSMTEVSVAALVKVEDNTYHQTFVQFWNNDNDRINFMYDETLGTGSIRIYNDILNDNEANLAADSQIDIGTWYHVAWTFDSSGISKLYINGQQSGSSATFSHAISDLADDFVVNIGLEDKNNSYLDGQIDHIYIYSRVLCASEIAYLYRESFCMFERSSRPVFIDTGTGEDILAGSVNSQSTISGSLSNALSLIGLVNPTSELSAVITIINTINGSITGISDVTAILKSTRGISASIGIVTSVSGSLSVMGEVLLAGSITASASISGAFASGEYAPWVGGLLETERNWIREALFNGMTANAIKLGTSLSMGWFWVRVSGCSALYRGAAMREMDFVNILAIAENGASEISPPAYNLHNIDSTRLYVLRMFNSCGYQEQTLEAAVKVSIDTNGDIASPVPNNIFSSTIKQTYGNKIRLFWFYCQLEQKSEPTSFNVYYDNGTGQIDYQNPLATISYNGPRFYSYQISTLQTGEYQFAIRAEDYSGTENGSFTQQGFSLKTINPNAINIVSAEGM